MCGKDIRGPHKAKEIERWPWTHNVGTSVGERSPKPKSSKRGGGLMKGDTGTGVMGK